MAFPHSLHAWQASRTYKVGEVVRASRGEHHTLAFKCIVAGLSGSSEPEFPRQITSTAIDNTITWEAFEPLAEQLQALAPTAVIEFVDRDEDAKGLDSGPVIEKKSTEEEVEQQPQI